MREERRFYYTLGINSKKVNISLFKKLCEHLGGDFQEKYEKDADKAYLNAINGELKSYTKLQGSVKDFFEKYLDIITLDYLIIKTEWHETSYITDSPNLLSKYFLENPGTTIEDCYDFRNLSQNSNYSIVLYQHLENKKSNSYSVFKGTDKELLVI